MDKREARIQSGAADRVPTRAQISRRELVRRTGLTGAALVGTPLLASMRLNRAAAQDEIPRTPSTAKLDGTLRIVLVSDFHPDHNAFMRAELEAFAGASGWSSFEISDAAGYQGGGDLFQKLLGGVQADDAPDLVIHNLSVRNFVTLGLATPVTDLVNEMVGLYGETVPGAATDSVIDGEWYGVPFFSRAGGFYVRKDVFAEHGLDPDADTETYDKMRDSALAVSDSAENMYGWGMTVNRSGDGNAMVQDVMFRYGGHVQDESGQKVTFNSPETVAALEWLKETYTAEQYAPMLPPGVLSWIDTDNNAAFLAGQLAITANAGTMYAKAIFDEVPFADQILYVPRPVRNTDGKRIDIMNAGTRFYQITGSPNTDATADIIRHFLTPPVQERVWSISTGYALPAYASGWDNPIITEDENSMRGKAIALTETDFTGLHWPGPLNEAIGSIGEGVFFTDMMSEIIQGRAVDEVVADYHDQFVQIYQDFGLEGE